MENVAIKALTTETWKNFGPLVQKHNGVKKTCPFKRRSMCYVLSQKATLPRR
jgi:hypothetical protein